MLDLHQFSVHHADLSIQHRSRLTTNTAAALSQYEPRQLRIGLDLNSTKSKPTVEGNTAVVMWSVFVQNLHVSLCSSLSASTNPLSLGNHSSSACACDSSLMENASSFRPAKTRLSGYMTLKVRRPPSPTGQRWSSIACYVFWA